MPKKLLAKQKIADPKNIILESINQLLEKYSLEGIAMPYTMEEFRKDYIKAHLSELEPEERLKGLRPEEIEAYLKRISKKHKARPGRR